MICRSLILLTLLCVAATSPSASADQTLQGFLPGVRYSNPQNFYVATTGSDSNSCTTSGSPCLTIQGAVDKALGSYDFQNANATINIAAGTYGAGVKIAGSQSSTAHGGVLRFVGAGSATTSISISTCSGQTSDIIATTEAAVSISGLALTTSCSGGVDLLVESQSNAFIQSDVNFGAAAFALIQASGHALVSAFAPITVSGGGTYAFLMQDHSTIILAVGATNVISGNPNFTVFVDAIDNSLFDTGTSSSFSGSIGTGVSYSLALNSTIDTEQSTTPLPGTKGSLEGGSYYYTNLGVACVAGVSGCSGSAPTGLGVGGTATLATGSSDHSGAVVLHAGTGPSTSGTLSINLASSMTGDTGSGGFCTVSLSPSNTQWPSGAQAQGYSSAGSVVVDWSGVIAASNLYGIGYLCN